MIYAIIVIILGVAIVISTNMPVEVLPAQIDLIEANPIGMWYGHFYLDEKGIKQFVEVTQQEFESGDVNVKGTYIGGGCLTKFDTPSGHIEDGYFFQEGESQVVKIAGKVIQPLPVNIKVINGTLDTTLLPPIQDQTI